MKHITFWFRKLGHSVTRSLGHFSSPRIVVIALCLACALATTGVAQTNSEYNFRLQGTADGEAFGYNGDPTPILTMDCLAANGYGQWTLSSLPGSGTAEGMPSGADFYPQGWYLLANALYPPSTKFDPDAPVLHPGCIPPGVVQSGQLAGFPPGTPPPSEPEATANLEGAVTFVWPDATRQTFDAQGFRASNVNLSLSFLANPAPPMNNIVAPAIPPIVSTTIPTGTPAHNVLGVGGVEAPLSYHDEFDVASDAAFLYITWCSTTNMSPGATVSEIWVEVLDINTLAVVLGPIPASVDGGGALASGMRPTIACDPRNNRTGTIAPKFEEAFIAPVSGSYMHFGGRFGGQLVWEDFDGGFIPHPISTLVLNPAGSMDPDLGYLAAWHARAAVSSVRNGAWHAACYAIVDNEPELILYNADDPNIPPTKAAYVDGMQVAPPLGSPLPVPTLPQIGWPVKDAPIVALANPYDNQNVSTDVPPDWRGYDQFHCLYQSDISLNPTNPPGVNYPLIIVRTSDNGDANPAQPNPHTGTPVPDTRLVLNGLYASGPPHDYPGTLWGDPDRYCAAVNQMGIHVHWRFQLDGSTIHYYDRDMNRAFDEPIDENTLVTDQCAVTDGSATGTNHGGTVGATISDGLKLSVWTDPNYGPPSLDGTSGLYTPMTLSFLNPLVGTLNFAGENVKLTVGDGMSTGSTLTVVPFFYFNFPGIGQGVTVNANSEFNYFGLNATHDDLGDLSGTPPIATPFTDGTADGTGAGEIDLEGTIQPPGNPWPAHLIVNGGSDFFVGAGGKLVSNYGEIKVPFEPPIYPAPFVGYAAATGHLTLFGQTALTNGSVLGYIPGGVLFVPSRQLIMTVDHGYNSSGTSDPQFIATSVSFANMDNTGTSELLFGHANRLNSDPGFEYSKFDGCDFSAMEIHAIDPPFNSGNPLVDIVDHCAFQNIRNKCIYIQNDQDPEEAQYGAVTIDANTFGSFASDADQDNVSDDGRAVPFGIYFKNLDANASTDNFTFVEPVISNNSFTYSGDNYKDQINFNEYVEQNYRGVGSSAIGLENTTASVTGNTIKDRGYCAGIGMRYTTPPGYDYFPRTYSVICSNTVSGMKDSYQEDPVAWDEYGINTSYSLGIISKNTITDNDFGIECYFWNDEYFLYNTVTDNLETQFEVNENSFAHLSGYPAQSGAFNTFSGYPQITGELDGSDEQGTIMSALGSYYNETVIDMELGHNNITYTSEPTNSGINPFLFWTNGINLGVLDENWWGTDINPYYRITGLCSGECDGWNNDNTEANVYDAGYGYHGITIDPLSTGPYSPPPDAPCVPSGFPIHATADPSGGGIKGKSTVFTRTIYAPSSYTPARSKSASRGVTSGSPVTSDTTYDETLCDSLFYAVELLEGAREWQQTYDSAEAFIETCYNSPNAPMMFGVFASAWEQIAGHDSAKMAQGQRWLESVLYLNTTNPEYFCACVEHFGIWWPDTGGETHAWRSENRTLAIDRWLIQNTSCDTPHIQGWYDASRESQRDDWLNDTNVLYDTTLPALDSIEPGLEELLDRHLLYASVADRPPNAPMIISDASASPNPVNTGTVISFAMNKEAYVKIQLYDVLGKQLGNSAFESLFQPGNKSVPISLAGLPSGTYYARIVTAYGEVQTVKLVKE